MLESHCLTCICGRRAPVQGDWYKLGGKPNGTISWEEYLKAYEVYAHKYGRGQTAERLVERGGFGYDEITQLLGHEPKTWSVREHPSKDKRG